MKQFFIFISIASVLFFSACLKDASTVDLYAVPHIGIDTTGVPARYSIFQNDTLRIKPKISFEGADKSRLTYSWVLHTHGGYERLLGSKEALEAELIEAPSPNPYKLIFTARDSTNNVKAFFTWDILVISQFGQGLVVADMRDDQASDVSLIMSYNFTTSILTDSASTKIFRDAYSRSNGEKIAGRVNQLSFFKYSTYKDVTFLTDKGFTRIDVNSYVKKDADKGLFVIAPDKIVPGDISTAILTNQHQYIINDGKGYGRYGDAKQFVYSFLASDKLGYQAEKICGLQNPVALQTGGVLYDKRNNRFLLLPRMSSMANPLTNFSATDSSNPLVKFDPNNMGNKTCLQLFEGYDARIIAIMKERDQAKYYAYQIKLTQPLTGAMGIAMNDLSQNPDIAKAKYFTSSTAEQVLFYASEDKVYSSILELGSAATTTLRYTAKPGEKITGMEVYFGAGTYDPGAGRVYLPSSTDPNDWSKRISVSAKQRMLILSTYNESSKEGKIITIPIEILGIGGLTSNPAYITSYGGFGRITAFGIQI